MSRVELLDNDAERRRLGETLRRSRERLGFTQDEVAEVLKVQRTAVTNIERGQRKVDALELKRLARLYRQPVSLFTGEDDALDAGLPSDVFHIARQAAALCASDREALRRFADFLRMRARESAAWPDAAFGAPSVEVRPEARQ